MKSDSIFASLPKTILSPAREQQLIRRLPSKAAQTQLAVESMWEAVVFLRSCAAPTVSTGELFSMAWDSLTRASRNFQPGRKIRFFDYAKHYLRGNFRRTLRLQSMVVRNAAGQLPLETHCDDTDHHNSGDFPIRFDEICPTNYTFDHHQVESKDELRALAPVLMRLSVRDRALLHQKFFLDLTYTEIAVKKRVSRQAIEARIKRILRRLRWMVKLDRIQKGITE